jgi:hypothetical protein
MKIQTVEKTDKLDPGQFVKDKQPWRVADALTRFSGPVPVEDIVEEVKKNGYEKLLNEWAIEHGGVAGSVRYHLLNLSKKGMAQLNTFSDAATPAEAAAEVQQSLETTFGLERDLQAALRANISQLQDGLKIADGGKERTVPSGRVDILAVASDGTHVVIELKAGMADRDAVGQILSYMGDLDAEGKRNVRGILVAADFTERAISASNAVPNVHLMKYGFKFSFQGVS